MARQRAFSFNHESSWHRDSRVSSAPGAGESSSLSWRRQSSLSFPPSSTRTGSACTCTVAESHCRETVMVTTSSLPMWRERMIKRICRPSSWVWRGSTTSKDTSWSLHQVWFKHLTHHYNSFSTLDMCPQKRKIIRENSLTIVIS